MTRSKFSILRFLGVFLMLTAWGVASNRCAIAGMMLKTDAAKIAEIHKCCPPKSTGGGGPTPEKRSNECCQGLRVLPTESSAKLVKVPDALEILNLVRACPVVCHEEGSSEQIERAIRPAETRSFAEVVLQGSLLSHAPPSAV